MKQMKFLIGNDPELSAWIQEQLFKLGYHWNWLKPNQTVKHTDRVAIFANDDGELTQTDDMSYAERHEYKEINIDWARSPTPPRETIKIGEHTYYKADIEERLNGLETVK